MSKEDIFTAALGLSKPWYISEVRLEDNSKSGLKTLMIKIDFEIGNKFTIAGETSAPYDTVVRTWRHMNFFQHECYLEARVPRIRMKDGSTLQVDVPWARPGSSFTLLFEAFAMTLVKHSMSLAEAGRTLKVDARVVGRVINSYVQKAKEETPLNKVERLSVDETSIKKGHNYITIMADLEEKNVVGISEGRDLEAFNAALCEMEKRNAPREAIKEIAMDMSPAYISAVNTLLPNAEKVIDRFHVEQMLSKAVDKIRKKEARQAKELRRTKYLWLKNKESLNEEQKEKVHYLLEIFPNLGTAYRLKETFKEIFNNSNKEAALEALNEWVIDAKKANLEEINSFCDSLKRHWNGIIAFFDRRLTSAFAERVNLKIQEIKRSARGYRNISNFISMIYFHLGKLPIPDHN